MLNYLLQSEKLMEGANVTVGKIEFLLDQEKYGELGIGIDDNSVEMPKQDPGAVFRFKVAGADACAIIYVGETGKTKKLKQHVYVTNRAGASLANAFAHIVVYKETYTDNTNGYNKAIAFMKELREDPLLKILTLLDKPATTDQQQMTVGAMISLLVGDSNSPGISEPLSEKEREAFIAMADRVNRTRRALPNHTSGRAFAYLLGDAKFLALLKEESFRKSIELDKSVDLLSDDAPSLPEFKELLDGLWDASSYEFTRSSLPLLTKLHDRFKGVDIISMSTSEISAFLKKHKDEKPLGILFDLGLKLTNDQIEALIRADHRLLKQLPNPTNKHKEIANIARLNVKDRLRRGVK